MAALAERLKEQARLLGFDLSGIAPAITAPGAAALRAWLEQGYAGEMHYMARHAAARTHPEGVLADVRSVFMVALNYRTSKSPCTDGTPGAPGGRIACYAWGDDYHDVLRERLGRLLKWVQQEAPGCRGRAVVDTAPLLERDFARLAGLGWFGKNTMLLNKRLGSYFFLGALLLDIDLPADKPFQANHCGTCTACLDACPTQAFTGPYELDARRCISYLTIELRQPIPTELRPGMGPWIFGCDICQDVCPWNRKAPLNAEPAFRPRAGLDVPDLVALLRLTRAQFGERFHGSALTRPRRDGLLRNVAIALGNSGDPKAIPPLLAALDDDDALVRGAAAWALGRLGGNGEALALQARLESETDAGVRGELAAALEELNQPRPAQAIRGP
jgi:epoxyqueuosine reductase